MPTCRIAPLSYATKIFSLSLVGHHATAVFESPIVGILNADQRRGKNPESSFAENHLLGI